VSHAQIGNEYLHEITSSSASQKPYSLLIQLIDINGIASFVMYDTFRVLDEAHNYTLQLGHMFGTFSGKVMIILNLNVYNVVDTLSPFRNAPFGTFDMDTDNVKNIKCGEQWQSGWWHERSECGTNDG
jgi:hypothetical protein